MKDFDPADWIQGNDDGSVTFCGTCKTTKCPTAKIDDGKVVVAEFGKDVAFGREQALALAAYIQEAELAGRLK